MNEIIPISSRTIGEAAVPTVNLRELHKKLETGRDFPTWVKGRLEESMAVEGIDYLVHKTGDQVPHQGGFRKVVVKDYFVTVEIAKHIAMLERNQRGREIRAYFIEAEKALRAMPTTARNMGPVELARLHLAAALRLEASGKAMEMLVPLNQYGELAPNGRAKLGLRRAAFVASRHRRDAAEEFIATMEKIDELERQLELGLEEVAA